MSDHPKPRLLTRAELAHGRKLIEEAFEGPWRYNQFEIECRACESYEQALTDTECSNPQCDGAHVPATFVEAPDAYPADEVRPQIVATIEVPGIDTLAQRNGECICWLRNNADALIEAREQLNEIAAALAWLSSTGNQVTPSLSAPVASVVAYAKSLGWDGDQDA